jgi:hypothetical protein
LVALSADARTREQIDWLAEEIIEAGGVETVWLATPAARAGSAIAEAIRATSGAVLSSDDCGRAWGHQLLRDQVCCLAGAQSWCCDARPRAAAPADQAWSCVFQ